MNTVNKQTSIYVKLGCKINLNTVFLHKGSNLKRLTCSVNKNTNYVNVLRCTKPVYMCAMIHHVMAVVLFEVILYICVYACDLILVCSEGQELACLLKRLLLIS